uniref:Uncharacterized protein n=1 Tax=Medicago truncatula TaxID=3880 RepID=I3SIT0_MEDTR|nr:unknown [Medicago truncatula]
MHHHLSTILYHCGHVGFGLGSLSS